MSGSFFFENKFVKSLFMKSPFVNFIHVQNVNTLKGSSAELKNGSSVFVKVLEKIGEEKYLVHLSGRNFFCKTEMESPSVYVSGQSFTAQINAENGIISLTKILNTKQENVSEKSAAELLKNLGLSGDEIDVKLLTLLMSLGVKIDSSLMKKARLKSLQFGSKQKQAAEAAALLLAENIDADKELIQKCLDAVECYRENSDENSEGNPEKETVGFNNEITAESIKEYFFNEKVNSLKEESSGCGIEAFLNHLKNKEPFHWIFLPFKWNVNGKNYSGIIRMLLNCQAKTTERVTVECNLNNNVLLQNTVKKYFFVLYYELSKVKEIRFCTLPPLLTSRIQTEEKKLGHLFSSGMNCGAVSVIYSTSALTDGFCTNQEELVFHERYI